MQRIVKAVLVVSPFLTASACPAKGQQFTASEIGVDTSIVHPNRLSSFTDAGLGGRFTFNVTPSLSIDSEFDSYLTNFDQRSAQSGGRAIVGLTGPKAGIRTRKYGIFFKARPGFMSFGDVPTSNSTPGNLITARKTHAALDVGTVAEFYPSSRTILRFDIGALLVRYGDATLFSSPTFIVRATDGIGAPWHITVGAGYRLGALQERQESSPAPQRFQAGGLYSLLTSDRGLQTLRDESGVGGWFTWNFNKYFALDSSATFFPRLIHIADFQQGGRIFQALAGVRGGVRRGRIGVFGKFRPGIQRYSATEMEAVTFKDSPFTDIAFDTGGIIEFYGSHRTLFRLDAGNTSVRYRVKEIPGVNGQTFHIPGLTNNTIQLTVGFGFRF